MEIPGLSQTKPTVIVIKGKRYTTSDWEDSAEDGIGQQGPYVEEQNGWTGGESDRGLGLQVMLKTQTSAASESQKTSVAMTSWLQLLRRNKPAAW